MSRSHRRLSFPVADRRRRHSASASARSGRSRPGRQPRHLGRESDGVSAVDWTSAASAGRLQASSKNAIKDLSFSLSKFHLSAVYYH